MDSAPRDWISARDAWNFPGKTKITPHESQVLSNPSDVFGKKTWKAKWGMDRCDGQVRELKMERQRRGNSSRERQKRRKRDRECGGRKKDGGKERERQREGKRRGETAVGDWMGVSMVILSSFSTCRETMVLTM